MRGVCQAEMVQLYRASTGIESLRSPPTCILYRDHFSCLRLKKKCSQTQPLTAFPLNNPLYKNCWQKAQEAKFFGHWTVATVHVTASPTDPLIADKTFTKIKQRLSRFQWWIIHEKQQNNIFFCFYVSFLSPVGFLLLLLLWTKNADVSCVRCGVAPLSTGYHIHQHLSRRNHLPNGGCEIIQNDSGGVFHKGGAEKQSVSWKACPEWAWQPEPGSISKTANVILDFSPSFKHWPCRNT